MVRGRTSAFIEAEDLMRLCKMGKMFVVKEHTPKGPQYLCISKSGWISGKVHKDYGYMFEAFLSEHGSGDGLIDGDHQTGAVKD